MTAPASMHIRHGYTLGDLDHMTHAAMIADRSMALDWADKRDVAWSAIAEALCVAEEPPHRQELIRVGWQAIYATVRDSFRSRGYSDGNFGTGDPTMPRFLMFWGPMVTHSHEDRMVERIAVGQVVDTLTAPYHDAVVALAATEDYALGAESLGISYPAFVARVNVARKRVLHLWHEGETPRRQNTTDRRVVVHGRGPATHCPHGHEWTPENTITRTRLVKGNRRQNRRCRACEHERYLARRQARRAS